MFKVFSVTITILCKGVLIFVSGVLNPLDSPHHMRAGDDALYREGVVLNKPARDGRGSFVNIGLIKVSTSIMNITQSISNTRCIHPSLLPSTNCIFI